ncbi:class I SAM-dependent methyltransferase [Aromatoleum bremense]|uniref:Methyltransferase domain-containing protein n=1 Tax=Aromatoleum bremense TaxID=76115 RepID=A0ABX1NX35_9RHOO|nr:methyltransferase domain-containing protein [Aromatoleum bremense]NMG16353.1 methyltransferase domain-containing protein [Aromatoleum bremense]
MRLLQAGLARLAAPLRWLCGLPRRLHWLETGVIAHNQRLDSLETHCATVEARNLVLETQHRALEAYGRALEAHGRALEARLEPLTRLHHPAPIDFTWLAPAPRWIELAERRIGRSLSNLAPAEKRAAFYSYYSEMGGGHTDILQQQYAAYLPLLPGSNGPVPATGLRILDIGCGAGEFLAFLRNKGIPGVGIDLSATEVQRAVAAGLDVVHATAAEFLQRTDECFAAITLLQVIEHLPPEDLLPTLEACVARLAPGGLLLVETINLRHPLAINGFYTDPTHQKPLSDNYLGFVLQWLGLQGVRILYNLPDPMPGVPADDPTRLYANYTVFGYAPAPAGQ